MRWVSSTICSPIRDPLPVAAILMEPVQGEGGYVVPPTRFVKIAPRDL